MIKIFSKLTNYIGLILIILFSSISVFFSYFARDIENPSIKSLTSYSSFFEDKFYDFRMKQKVFSKEKSKDIILIKLDDESLQKIGSFPIPRSYWAKLIKKLRDYEAKVIAFDVMFPEKSENKKSDLFLKEEIEKTQETGTKIILPYTLQEYPSNETFEELPDDLFDFILNSKQEIEGGVKKSFIERYTYPNEIFRIGTPLLSYITMMEDSDGVFRHYKLISNFDDLYLPSIGLQAYEYLKGIKPEVRIKNNGSISLKLKNLMVPLNSKGESKIRWMGGENYYEQISLTHFLNEKENFKELVQNKLIFIASTAKGAHDLRNTPIDSKLPGVYAHMNLVSMLSEGHLFRPLFHSLELSLGLMFIGLFILLFIMKHKKALLDIFALLILSFALYEIDQYYFLANGFELKLFFIFTSFILTYSWLTFLNFSEASREKKQIKGAFSRYVAPAIVNDMLAHPEKLKAGGEKMDITCLFSDVRDFTSISESLSANELASSLNFYMGKMTDIVFNTKGTIDKYIGDAVVAFWGAPISDPHHPDDAVRAALMMIESLPEINLEFRKRGTPEFRVGIGLNSGECNVGNMGSDQIFAYTALGDNMNLGARLESLCKHYGAQILISEYTFKRIDTSLYDIRMIDKVAVKGKTQAVEVYEILHSRHIMKDPLLQKKYINAYELFKNKNFYEAKELFSEILKTVEDIPTMINLKKCEEFLKTPPHDDLDHLVTIMHEK